MINNNQKAAQNKKKHTLRNVIIILAALLIVSLVAGFFIYVRTWRLFPNMPGLIDLMTGTDHFTRTDHVGLYEHGNNSDITDSGSQNADRLVLMKVNGMKYDLQKEPVTVDTTSFSRYSLYPCEKPADISLIFDKNDKLCCSEIVYHYTADELGTLEQDMNQLIYAVDRRFRPNVLFSAYATIAHSLGFKRYNVMRVGSAEDTQLVVQEFYRTHAYD